MEYKGLFGFDDDDEGGGCDEKVSRKRVRSVSEVEEEEDDEDKNGVEVSDMFVCSGEGCYQKVIHVGVVEDENKRCLPYVLPCPLYVRADKYSRFVNGRMESYDVKSLLERLNKALYVDGGTRFSEWRRYVVTDMLLGNGDNAVFLAEMLMKVLSGVLIVDMVDVDVDTMVGELRLNMEKMRRMVTLLDEYISPLEQYNRLPMYRLVMGCWYSYVCMDSGMSDKFANLLERLKTIAQSNSVLYMESKEGRELYSHIKLISAWWVLRSTGFEKLMNLPSVVGEDMEILQQKPIEATEIMCALLSSRGVILVGSDNMYSVPIYVRGNFTYTYSKPYKFGELMRELNVLDTHSHLFAQFGTYISKYFETTTVEKSVPYVDNKYFTTNRFISWRNGIFCCITGVFYYNEDGLRRSRMPGTWPYTVAKLKMLMGKSLILSMKYFDMDLLYDVYWMVMLVSLYRRERGYVESVSDENAVLFDDGMVDGGVDGDMLWNSFSDDEKSYVSEEMKDLDTNMHNPAYLKRLDPLDVRLRGAQKIVGDQRIPRGAYRILLEMFGRCFSGVIRSVYDSSNDKCGGPSFQYEMLTRHCGRGLEDRMDIGTVLSGAAVSAPQVQVQLVFN
jgi:hypothetical protein